AYKEYRKKYNNDIAKKSYANSMIHRTWYKIADGYKKCSYRLCKHPWKLIDRFAKDKSQPDGLCIFCKDCQKDFRDKHKKKYASSQAHNLREYKSVKIEALNPARRPCVGWCGGKYFDSTDETDRFCPKCKKKKQWMVDNHEMTEEYEMGE
ncbi:unnamed protein product, partial [marine sediment metagenome]